MSLTVPDILHGGSSLTRFVASSLPGRWGLAARVASGMLSFGAGLVEAGVDPVVHVARIRDQHDVVMAALDRADAEMAAIAAQHEGAA